MATIINTIITNDFITYPRQKGVRGRIANICPSCNQQTDTEDEKCYTDIINGQKYITYICGDCVPVAELIKAQHTINRWERLTQKLLQEDEYDNTPVAVLIARQQQQKEDEYDNTPIAVLIARQRQQIKKTRNANY